MSDGILAVEEFETTKSGRSKVAKLILTLGILLVVMIVGLVALRAFVFQLYWIPSPAMEPEIQVGDRVIVNRLDTSAEPGDVIIYEIADPTPDAPREAIKRVVAVGGETVEAVDGKVLVDGEPIEEPYLGPGVVTDDFGPVEVPEGHLFILGDNRPLSSDSRFEGPVPEDSVVGTVIGR